MPTIRNGFLRGQGNEPAAAGCSGAEVIRRGDAIVRQINEARAAI